MRPLYPLLLGLALVGLTAAPAPANDAATIARLIEQLGADTFAEREAASKALDKIGTPALEAVQKATKSGDAEVRKRATELAGKIGRRAASEATLAPKMVHLAFKDTPVKEAVQGFAQKSGYDIVLSDPADKLKDKRVTLDTGKATFWAAMEKFCAAAGVVEGDPNTAAHAAPPAPMPARGPIAAPATDAPAIAPAPAAPPPPAPPKKGKVEKDAEEKKEAAAREAEQLRAAVAALALVMKEVPPAPPGGAMPPKPAPALAPRFVAVAGVATGGLGYEVAVPAGRITLVPGEEKVPADTSSSIRVRAADRKRFPARAGEKEVGVLLEVSAEPRLLLQQVQSIQIDVATDDHGQKLKQLDPVVVESEGPAMRPKALGGVMPGAPGLRPGFSWFPPGSNGIHMLTGLKLRPGEKGSKSLERLEGMVNAHALGAREDLLVVESPGKAAGKSVKGKQGGEINVTAVTKQPDGSVQIAFEFEAPAGVLTEMRYRAAASAEAARAAAAPLRIVAGGAVLPVVMPGQTFHTPWGLTLQDDKGHALPASIRPNFRKGGGGKVEYFATYQPGSDGKGEPAKLVYAGRRQLLVQVPFKLSGVELR